MTSADKQKEEHSNADPSASANAAEEAAPEEEKVAGITADDTAANDDSKADTPDTAADANESSDRPSDNAQPSTKRNKRTTDTQLNKDDHPEGDDDDDGELNEEGGLRSDPFKRAPENVLKERKIVKAKKSWGGVSTGNAGAAVSSNPFAAVKLTTASATDATPAEATPAKEADKGKDASKAESETAAAPTTTIFGSGTKIPSFGSAVSSSGFGFGNVKSTGFAAVSSATDNVNSTAGATSSPSLAKASSLFGGGFGSVSTGFGSVVGTSGFGGSGISASSPAGAVATATTPSNGGNGGGSGLAGTFANYSNNSTAPNNPSIFPASSIVNVPSGEPGEDIAFEVRSKLFKWAPVEETEEDGGKDEAMNKGDVPSVPSTVGRMEFGKAKVADREEKQTEESTEEVKDDKEPAAAEETAAAEVGEKNEASATKDKDEKPKMEWKEAGIGQLKIKKRKPPFFFGGDKGKNEDTKGEEESKKNAISARVTHHREKIFTTLLNAPLIPGVCRVYRKSDQHVRLDAPDAETNGGRTVGSYLFKVKTKAEADELERHLNDMLKEEGKQES